MSRLLRLGLVVVSMLIGAWFVLGWVQARDAGQADALLAASSSQSPAQAAHIRSLLNSAGTLNPDRGVDLSRARLDLHRHQYAAAIAILRAVTRAEPENAFAWAQLGFTAGAAGQIPLARQAGRHVAGLVPRI